MAARGGLGPVTPLYPAPLSAQTYSMTPAVTLERNPTVKFEPTTRSFELRRSIDAPRTIDLGNTDLQQARLRKGSSREDTRDNGAKDSGGNWFSRWFGRPTRADVGEDTKQYP